MGNNSDILTDRGMVFNMDDDNHGNVGVVVEENEDNENGDDDDDEDDDDGQGHTCRVRVVSGAKPDDVVRIVLHPDVEAMLDPRVSCLPRHFKPVCTDLIVHPALGLGGPTDAPASGEEVAKDSSMSLDDPSSANDMLF